MLTRISYIMISCIITIIIIVIIITKCNNFLYKKHKT
jgi:hypothetical protein